jgi:hypothetical protein
MYIATAVKLRQAEFKPLLRLSRTCTKDAPMRRCMGKQVRWRGPQPIPAARTAAASSLPSAAAWVHSVRQKLNLPLESTKMSIHAALRCIAERTNEILG